MKVFDASALLAFLYGEPGAERVEAELGSGGACSAANWSEIAQKCHAGSSDWTSARKLLLSFGLAVEPVTAADAETAATLWATGASLSLADRLCLALGQRLSATVFTADRHWEGRSDVVLVR